MQINDVTLLIIQQRTSKICTWEMKKLYLSLVEKSSFTDKSRKKKSGIKSLELESNF